jgi:Arc/MetJ-type ribon-helix-helix transcriptional regulator
VTKHEWARPAPWMEVVARSGGRAKYNSIRKLRARLRRWAIVRRLRYVDDIHQRGLKRQLAEELGVVANVICEDIKQIMAAGGPGGYSNGKPRDTGVRRRPHQPKEEAMSQRCTVRLPDMIYEFVQIEADARQCSTSDVIRDALAHLLGLASDHGAKSTKAPEPAPLSTLPPHDCGQTVLAQLLPEVRTRIVETARLLNVSVLHIIRSLLIAQTWPKDQAAPQVPQAALLDAAPASATPIPRTSPSATGARPTAPSPAALGVHPPSRSPYGPDAG